LGAKASMAGPVTRVHVDYNEVSAPKRLQQLAERPGYTGVQLRADAEKAPVKNEFFERSFFEGRSLVMSCVHFDVFMCAWPRIMLKEIMRKDVAPCKVLGSGQRFAFINVWRSIVARCFTRAAAVLLIPRFEGMLVLDIHCQSYGDRHHQCCLRMLVNRKMLVVSWDGSPRRQNASLRCDGLSLYSLSLFQGSGPSSLAMSFGSV